MALLKPIAVEVGKQIFALGAHGCGVMHGQAKKAARVSSSRLRTVANTPKVPLSDMMAGGGRGLHRLVQPNGTSAMTTRLGAIFK